MPHLTTLRNGHISFFNLRGIIGIRKVGVRNGHLGKIRTFHATLNLSPIISLQLADIIPAENCRDFRFHSGLDLLYLSSSLSWNILLSQPLSHHGYTLTYANWHRIVKGSSYRFIPPSCDLSSLRFGPGRIQKPVTWPGARTRKFSMRLAGVPPWLNLQTWLSIMREASKMDRQFGQCEAGEWTRPVHIQSGNTDDTSSSLGHA